MGLQASAAADRAAAFATSLGQQQPADLGVEEVFELLHLLGFPVTRSALATQGVTGAVLFGLTEEEMKADLGIRSLGHRRWLSLALKRLVASGGIARPALMNEIAELRKHMALSGTVVAAVATRRGSQGRLALEEALLQNGALQRLVDGILEGTTGGDPEQAKQDETPRHFRCPIGHSTMADPVVAMDGFTYERSAIEKWFRSSPTSPMTRASILPTVVPNMSLRSQIAAWDTEWKHTPTTTGDAEPASCYVNGAAAATRT